LLQHSTTVPDFMVDPTKRNTTMWTETPNPTLTAIWKLIWLISRWLVKRRF